MIQRKRSQVSKEIRRNFARAAVVLAAGICTACGDTTRDTGNANSQGGDAGAYEAGSAGRTTGGASSVGGSNAVGGRGAQRVPASHSALVV